MSDLLPCNVLCPFGGYVGQFPIVVRVFRRYGEVWEGLGSEVVGVSRGLWRLSLVFPVMVVAWGMRGLYLRLLLLHLIVIMFRSPGQGDTDMMEGRSPNKCGRYVVSCVARRWAALSECRIVRPIRCMRLSWLGD